MQFAGPEVAWGHIIQSWL